MAKRFDNKFLSLAGQKERLQNAGKTLASAVTGKGVQSSTGLKVADKVISAAASRPFTTALVGAGVVTGGAATVSAVKSSPYLVGSVVVGAPIATSAIVSNPKGAAKSVSRVGGAERDISNFSGNLASIKSFDDVLQTVKENPVLSAVTVAGAGVIVGKGVTGTIASLSNTAAIRENTKAAAAVGNDFVAKVGKPVDLLPASAPLPDNLKNVDAPSPAPAAAAVTPAAAGQTINNYRQKNQIAIKQSFRNERFINKIVHSGKNGKHRRH